MSERTVDLHSDLARWIELNGGKVHNNLALHTPTASSAIEDDTTTDYTHRGIFALNGPIQKGEELIRLPSALTLDGQALPVSYDLYDSETKASTSRNASNWLRCIASYMHTSYQLENTKNGCKYDASDGKHEQSSVDYTQYIASLPKEYDSLLNWTELEIETFLAGTALSVNLLDKNSPEDTDTRWKPSTKSQHNDKLKLRYRSSIVPYLVYLQQNFDMFLSRRVYCSDKTLTPNERDSKRQKLEETNAIFEELYPMFREACMCVSSRAFHMHSQSSNGERNDYHGPFLLPYIDLLNHSPKSSTKHVTTLNRDPSNGSFVMVAERDIEVGEEICHSYDAESTAQNESNSSFTSAQTLQTFGFVDFNQTIIIDYFLESNNNPTSRVLGNTITPAVISKCDVCKSCLELSQSTYVTELSDFMQHSGLLDEGWEYWTLPSPSTKGSKRSTALQHIPDELVIPFEGPLTDQLITLCCFHFLPDEILDDLLQDDQTLLLNKEVLEDYFLGKIVLQAIENAIKAKLMTYEVKVNYLDLKEENNVVNTRVLSEFFDAKDQDTASVCWGKNSVTDASGLSKLMSRTEKSPWIHKFMYGITVSLEERACLAELRKEVCDLMRQL